MFTNDETAAAMADGFKVIGSIETTDENGKTQFSGLFDAKAVLDALDSGASIADVLASIEATEERRVAKRDSSDLPGDMPFGMEGN